MPYDSGPPPHRSFLSLELPFVVKPSRTCEDAIQNDVGQAPASLPQASPSEQRKIQSFLPPSVLHHFLLDDPTRQAGEAASVPSLAKDEPPPPSSETGRVSPQPLEGAAGSEKTKGFAVADPQLYSSEPLWRVWRGTDWESDEDDQHTKKEAASHHRSLSAIELLDSPEKEHQGVPHRTLFPSATPQLLINGYWRNDVLLHVRRRYRVKRIRSRSTGEILSETPVVDSAETPHIETSVLGVVSRELAIERPADFSFSLFTPREHAAAPLVCSRDVFPPAHYLSDRGMFEARYEMGRDVNTAVLAAEEVQQQPDGDGEPHLETSRVMAQRSDLDVLQLTADTSGSLLPPPQLPEQIEFLHRLGSSPTGLAPNDPKEIRVIACLLQARPVWQIKDLMEAALQTGVCPRLNFNKRVIHALTYVIPVGAYNRLRIRLDYNPYAHPTGVLFQRVAVRLIRRSDAGMLLRDISRSKHIRKVIEQIRADPGNEIPDPWVLPQSIIDSPPSSASPINLLDLARVPRLSLREHFCRMILRGHLINSFQLIDVMESEVYQHMVAKVIETHSVKMDEALSKKRREESFGWLSEATYKQVMQHFTLSLVSFIEDEVIQLLKEKVLPANPSEDKEESVSSHASASGDSSRSNSGSLSRASPSASDDDLSNAESSNSSMTLMHGSLLGSNGNSSGSDGLDEEDVS